MCGGVSISCRDVPESLIERFGLQDRIVVRAENVDREIRFLHNETPALIPAWIGGEFGIYSWGNRGGTDSRLPVTAWCRRENLEAGRWSWLKPEPVVIPAVLGIENGRWFQIDQGIQGIFVRDAQNRPHVYMLTEEASHYYHIMTGQIRMPVLVGQQL